LFFHFFLSDTLRKENIELKKYQQKAAAEWKAIEEKAKRDAKIHEFNMDALKTKLIKADHEISNLDEKLLGIFTSRQISKLKAGEKRLMWTEDDIAQSITLYSASAKLYKLLYRKKFPLPAIRTLQKWAQKVDINNGLLKPVFKILSAAKDMSELQKVYILSYDEMIIRKSYCWDKSKDTTLAPHGKVQVAMIRGE